MNDNPIQIRNPQVGRAIRRLATHTGRPLTETGALAVEAELKRRNTLADAALAREAAGAFARFGRRSGGRLNPGDCFAYALAAREGEGLLFKGKDVPKTDVLNALDR